MSALVVESLKVIVLDPQKVKPNPSPHTKLIESYNVIVADCMAALVTVNEVYDSVIA
jgi:hypothetical protein